MYPRKTAIIATNPHFKIVLTTPLVYLSIIPNIESGKYLFRNALKSFSPIFCFKKLNILNNISVIATIKTNDEKCRYKFSQENGLMVSTVLEELNRLNDYGVEKYRLEVGYNSTVRFKIEQFVTLIDVDIDFREKTSPIVIETTLHLRSRPKFYF